MPYDRPQLYRFPVAQYHRLWEHNILDPALRIELIEGLLYENMPFNPEGNPATRSFENSLAKCVPHEWALARSRPLPLTQHKPESETRPDYAVIRQSVVHLVIEIAGAIPAFERDDLGRIYARAGIPVYWVLDFAGRAVEVYTQPSGPIESPHYAKRDVYAVGTSVPVVLDGNTVGTIDVADVMG
jgi:Uma2 family endonuclease